MPTTSSSGPTIEYQTFGDGGDQTLLLVNGLGSQLINWEPAFCQRFVDRGMQVVVFDNRDVGLTSKTDGPAPDVGALMQTRKEGASQALEVPYTLADMASDGFAVMDAVGAEEAHIAGMSMGGMIVQRMAIGQPDRVISMTSIMSSTGDRAVGAATPEAAATLYDAPPADRDGYIEHTVASRRVNGGTYFSEDYWRRHQAKVYDRMFHPIGSAFQMAAVMSDGDRTDALGAVTVPTLVIHGRLDPLITLSGGEATAKAVPGAELLIIDEMGHDLPEEIWDQVVESMSGLFERA